MNRELYVIALIVFVTSLFTRSVDPAGAVEIVVAMTGVDAFLHAADANPSLFDGEGALIIRSTGVAGFLSGSADIGGGGVSASGTVLLQINTTLDAIDTYKVQAAEVMAATVESLTSELQHAGAYLERSRSQGALEGGLG